MAAKQFDPTLKTLVETSPGDWPVLLGLPPAPTEVIDADIATVSGAGDEVQHVRAAVRAAPGVSVRPRLRRPAAEAAPAQRPAGEPSPAAGPWCRGSAAAGGRLARVDRGMAAQPSRRAA